MFTTCQKQLNRDVGDADRPRDGTLCVGVPNGDRPPTTSSVTFEGDVGDGEVLERPPTSHEGKEHFSIWLREPGVPSPRFIKAWANEPWPEFIEGYHHDIRQPSTLQGLLQSRKDNHAHEA
jgi:hypothetical protein